MFACMWTLLLVRASFAALELAISSQFYYAFYAFLGAFELPLISFIFLATSRKIGQLSRATTQADLGSREFSRAAQSSFDAFRAMANQTVRLLVFVALCACAALATSLQGEERDGDGERATATTASSWLFVACGHAGVASLLLRCSQSTLTLVPSGTAKQRTRKRANHYFATFNFGSGHWASSTGLLGDAIGRKGFQQSVSAALKVARAFRPRADNGAAQGGHPTATTMVSTPSAADPSAVSV